MNLLVFQHVPHEHPGLIAQFAQENNINLHIVELWKDDYIIPDVTSYKGLIIMGGPMGVYEEYKSKNDELRSIQKALTHNTPILGFCLGSQLLAYALGADVHQNIINGKHIKEIGYYPIDLTSEGKRDILFQGFSSPVEVLEWHGDAFELPNNATLLATSPQCMHQAFRYKNAYGLLFHFEFTTSMIQRQIEIDKQWIQTNFSLNENQLIEHARKNESLMKEQCNKLLTNFLKLQTKE